MAQARIDRRAPPWSNGPADYATASTPLTVPVAHAGELPAPQRFTRTPPFTPAAAGPWMCAAVTLVMLILDGWSQMLEERFKPQSVLDVGAAYGFVVEYFRALGRRADGVEPSPFARERAAVELRAGSLPDLPPVPRQDYELVTCTEVLEHLHPDAVRPALESLARCATKVLVCLVEMGEWDEYHEDPSHIHLRPRSWWIEAARSVSGMELDKEAMAWLDDRPLSVQLRWCGRFLVFTRTPARLTPVGARPPG